MLIFNIVFCISSINNCKGNDKYKLSLKNKSEILSIAPGIRIQHHILSLSLLGTSEKRFKLESNKIVNFL